MAFGLGPLLTMAGVDVLAASRRSGSVQINCASPRVVTFVLR
jgi:hypothetical protein